MFVLFFDGSVLQQHWSEAEARGGRDGREEGRERGYYNLHHKLNDTTFFHSSNSSKFQVPSFKFQAIYFSFFILHFSFILLSCAPKNPHVSRVGSTPDEDKAYAKGVSGAYGGMLDGHLILAGGANFPEVPAAEGGVKRYYDAIYATTGRVYGSTGQQVVPPLAEGGRAACADGVRRLCD